jgi:DNA polymerase-4
MDQIPPAQRPPQRIILHVDMDAFYASVETLDNPALQGQAVVVGGLGPRGVVATANYVARASGVHSAMPMGKARRLCPEARFVPPRMKRYREVSATVFDVFQSITPLVEGLSLDEAFLDVSASQRLFGDREAIARRVKTAIFQGTGLTGDPGRAFWMPFTMIFSSPLSPPVISQSLPLMPDVTTGCGSTLPSPLTVSTY